MAVQGTPAFNAIEVAEVEAINFVHRDIELVAHAAFVNTSTGATYGTTTCRRWSKETIEKLMALKEAMERDVAALVFEDGTVQGASAHSATASEPVGGIGEHASEGGGTPEPEQL